MQRPELVGPTLVCLLALVPTGSPRAPSRPAVRAVRADAMVGQTTKTGPRKEPSRLPPPKVEPPAEAFRPMSEAKAARFASIQRDYQELRRDLLRRYGSEGELFPGGGDALLRQFALLDREEHADLAHLLAAEGVEELEYRDSQAGVLVQHRLGGSWANEAQRRAVFRLQRRFELRGGFPTDATPDALAARERLRQKIADQIHAVLGDVLFARWIAGGGAGANGANGG